MDKLSLMQQAIAKVEKDAVNSMVRCLYCQVCKRNVAMNNATEFVDQDRIIIQGNCKTCGTFLRRFEKLRTLPKYVAKGN